MCVTIEGLGNEFRKWQLAFESKCSEVFFGKRKVIVSAGITKNGLS